MFRKKKRGKNKKRTEFTNSLFPGLYEETTSKKGKKKKETKYLGYTRNEIEDICASMRLSRGIKVISSWN